MPKKRTTKPTMALSIRQPYLEQILRGIKTIEYRTMRTKRIGERFYLYASTIPGPLAEFQSLGLKPGDLPTGLILGSAIIDHCTPPTADMDRWHWHLRDVNRLKHPRKVTRHPQPIWFRPFDDWQSITGSH